MEFVLPPRYAGYDYNGAMLMFSNVFLDLHPVKVKRGALKLRYTFCLGGLTFFFFIVLTITGVFLMFYYVPDVRQAYYNIKGLQTAIYFGTLMRTCIAGRPTRWCFLSGFTWSGFSSPAPTNRREIQLGGGCGPAHGHTAAELDGLSAAVGPARALGDHGGDQDGGGDAAPWVCRTLRSAVGYAGG